MVSALSKQAACAPPATKLKACEADSGWNLSAFGHRDCRQNADDI